jgi:N-acetylmuramoyl-L-alanine amidase
MQKNYLQIPLFLTSIITLTAPVQAQQSKLFIAYPPNNHQTTSSQIFIIGSAPINGQVSINNQPINRSKQGNFAPSFPLKIGENIFKVKFNDQEQIIKVNRSQISANIPSGVAFAPNFLTPITNINRLTNELICFQAIAPQNAEVTVNIGQENIELLANNYQVNLPANSAILTGKNQEITNQNGVNYGGCTKFNKVGNLGKATYTLTLNGKTIKEESQGTLTITNQDQLAVIEVISNVGVARTGPSTDYSRLTPLPKGTIAAVTGKEGDWLRLDYGGWIKAEETNFIPVNNPPHSLIRSVNSKQENNETKIIFPLQIPVPITIKEGEKTFILRLYNTTAQTDTIKLDDDPIIKRLDWEQKEGNIIEYTFNLKSEQMWGYDVKYEGKSLVLSFRHPPNLSNNLQNISILLDPGHGGNESGSIGPTGYPEKNVNLAVSLLLKKQLESKGIKVFMTRETDKDVSLGERVELINKLKPTLAISVHYNALPDNGDAINTKGISMFWFNPQAHNLAVFLHNYLVKNLQRPSYGVFWNNLALTRPYSTPSILMELGFMINPDEFEWITNQNEQEKLAMAIANGIIEWISNK